MPSNVARGNHYKARSKRVLERAGYQVADMELVRSVFTPAGMMYAKRDQWGSDLIAKTEDEVVFVQVKSVAAGRSPDLASARRAFAAAGPWPPGTRRLIHVWRRGAREPLVTVVA